MARAGMALRRGIGHGNAEGDDVQRSIELLDKVLSEFDDVENANQVQNTQQITTSTSTPQLTIRQTGSNSTSSGGGNVSTTPDDESPSLGGHQSEDDGYMSMNGRKPKFNLAFKPLAEVPVHHENALRELPITNTATTTILRPNEQDDHPPPPEEAQRLIATLLPKVSPVHRSKNSRGFPLTQLPVLPPPQKFKNDEYTPIANGLLADSIQTSATQTTLPKTRHQRPYGWENNDFTLITPPPPPPPPPGYRFGSLPFQHGLYSSMTSPTKVPPRTIPIALERHREVRRRNSDDNVSSDVEEAVLSELARDEDDEHFSDDSLEEMLPPPPPITNKRASIAWEVPLDGDDVLTPGSTKVIGRRRRKSGSHSSTSSIPNKLKDLDDWPDPPPSDDDVTSPFSDSDEHRQHHVALPPELNSVKLIGTGTYVVRKGKKERNKLPMKSRPTFDLSIPRFVGGGTRSDRDVNAPTSRFSVGRRAEEVNSPRSRFSLDLNHSRVAPPFCDFNKHSTTFDNIEALIREGIVESCREEGEENVSELDLIVPQIVRVVSLPSLSADDFGPRRELDVTVEEEEEEDADSSQQSGDISPLQKIERNISELLERRDIDIAVVEDALNGVECLKPSRTGDLQKSSSHNEIQRCEDYYRQLLIDGGGGGGGGKFVNKRSNGIQKSESAKEMLIAHRENSRLPTSTSADVHHDFPPLPPSPVEEMDEDTLAASNEPPPSVPPHRESVVSSTSLKTRSMDVNYNRSRRNNFYGSGNIRNIPERRTLPNELQDSKRRQYHKRSSKSPQEEHYHHHYHHHHQQHHLQTSCSLPETPIFARGCDIPRTPHRRAPDIPGGGNQTAPRQSNTIGSLNTIGNMSTGGYNTRRGLEQAIVGAELLRLAGGPGRGWYPKQRHRRPASIEHLDRLATSAPNQNPWETSSRKPLTLPPNLTPKFFQRSPRDALRRVTSLLIRKGNGTGSKEQPARKEKEIVSPTIHENANGPEEVQKKRGFFKSFWKRSRHYSLEQQQ